MYAVDLVSGSDLGSSAANDAVYASDAGTVDYVCNDDTTVAVRTYNSTTGDYFIYAHLRDNAMLVLDREFSQGESIGQLKHGSFDDFCGWAEQKDNHWHLHWMFTPGTSNTFQAEDCILFFSDKKWHCGATNVIGTGQWLTHGNGYLLGHDDPGGTNGYEGRAPAELSFWDLLLVGIAFLIDPFFKLVPQSNGLNFFVTIYNTSEIFIRLLRVYAYGNINLGPLIGLIVMAWGFKMLLLPVRFFMWGVRTLKTLEFIIPLLG